MLPAFIFFIGLKKERNTIGNEGPIKLFCSYIFETDSNKQFCLLLRSKCLVPIAIGSKDTDSIFFLYSLLDWRKKEHYRQLTILLQIEGCTIKVGL